MKKTLILGASPNPDRYAYLAAKKLISHGHQVVLYGKRKGNIDGNEILLDHKLISDIDTITIYLNPLHQKEYYDLITKINPKRVIFNPGTENPELYKLLDKFGIDHFEACTLVLLSTNAF
ncbi:MAG: CoA-binding protein [Saprospiraceae bacterium]|nr:CoA-binding protein [Saprospiraceae bacterium]